MSWQLKTAIAAAVLVGSILVPAASADGADGADRPFAIRAKAYVDKAGATVEGATLLVENGKIAAIGPDVTLPDGCILLDRPDAVISPGFIDLHVTLGTMGRSGETAHSIETEADAAELFNRFHRDFDRAVAAGTTAVLLAPSSSHLVGGKTVAVKTAGDDVETRVLGHGPLKLSVAPPAFTTQRPPTSLQGGLEALRGMIQAARVNREDESAFAQWARGKAPALVDTIGEAELGSLARFATAEGVRCVALHANFAVERLADVKALGQPVVLGTYDFSDPLRFTRTPGILAKEEIGFALTSSAPRLGPELLRVGAAMARSGGVGAAAAFAAITTTPAKIAGIEDRVGSLEAGKDADFVLLSGHPLDLTSRILEVFVDGRRVHRAASGEKAARDGPSARWTRRHD